MNIAQKDMKIGGKIVKKGEEVMGVPMQELKALLSAGIVKKESKPKKTKDK